MSVQALSLAFATRGLSPSEKLVLLALANYADEDMRCWPSQEKISTDTELSVRSVWGAIKKLEALGLIQRLARKRSDGTRSTDVYTINFGSEQPVQPHANSAKTTRKICENHTQNLRKPYATVAYPTTFEPSEEEPSEKPVLAPLGLSGPALRAWKAFPETGRKRSSTKLVNGQWASASRAAGGGNALARCVENFAASDEAKRDGGKYVKAMHLWLRDGLWEHWLPAEPIPAQAVATLDPWPHRVREFQRNQYWNTTDWGPKPGKPGCIVPQSALEVA